MLVSLIPLLVALVPLITKFAGMLIDSSSANAEAAASAKIAFLEAVQAHVNDALASVNQHQQYQNQFDELKDTAAKIDGPDKN